MELHATTILTIRHDGRVAMGGDGQVTLGTAVMKADAVKIRRLEVAVSSVVLPVAVRTRLPCWSDSKPN